MKNFIIFILMLCMLGVTATADAKFGSSSSSPSSSMSRSSSTPSVSRPSSFGGGGNIGMQRQTARANNAPAYSSNTYQPRTVYQSNTVVHQPGVSTTGGYGMGSLAMAAMGGYMLNGIMHDRSGAVYNGPGYSNGAPIQGGQYDSAPVQMQPQYVQTNSGSSFLWFFIGLPFILIIIAAVVVFVRRVFF